VTTLYSAAPYERAIYGAIYIVQLHRYHYYTDEIGQVQIPNSLAYTLKQQSMKIRKIFILIFIETNLYS